MALQALKAEKCSLRAICCGGYEGKKVAAYVSAARVVLQHKFIDDFICKAYVACTKKHRSKSAF